MCANEFNLNFLIKNTHSIETLFFHKLGALHLLWGE